MEKQEDVEMTVSTEDVQRCSAVEGTGACADAGMGLREGEGMVPIAADTGVVPVTDDTFIHGLGLALSLWYATPAQKPEKPSCFHSSVAPPVSIQDYIKRLRKYFRCSDECFVIALVYIDRIGKRHTSMAVCELTVHRLLVIALMIAAKFHDDMFYSNRHYGKAGGLTIREVNLLEAVMLRALDFRVNVSVEEYQLYFGLVCQAIR